MLQSNFYTLYVNVRGYSPDSGMKRSEPNVSSLKELQVINMNLVQYSKSAKVTLFFSVLC